MEPTANPADVVSHCRQALRGGDVNLYWSIMGRQSPLARLAGDLAQGRGPLAPVVDGCLRRKAREARGRELDDREIHDLWMEIAHADLDAWRERCDRGDGPGLPDRDEVARYHRRAFAGAGLPPDTFDELADEIERRLAARFVRSPDAPTDENGAPDLAAAYATLCQGGEDAPRLPGELCERAREFLAQMAKSDEPADEILLKPAHRWTQDEVRAVTRKRMDLPSTDPRVEDMFGREMAWYTHVYGNDPVKYDETGRMIDPQPLIPIPEAKVEPEDADGGPLAEGLKAVAADMGEASREGGEAKAVRALQSGLNLTADNPGQRLAEDGDLGPKTRLAAKRAVAEKGSGSTREAVALGRFHEYAKTKTGDSTADDLGPELAAIFAPLADQGGPALDDAAYALQRTLNELGRDHFPQGQWRDIPVDGAVGEETGRAFALVLQAAGPANLARRFANWLGMTPELAPTA